MIGSISWFYRHIHNHLICELKGFSGVTPLSIQIYRKIEDQQSLVFPSCILGFHSEAHHSFEPVKSGGRERISFSSSPLEAQALRVFENCTRKLKTSASCVQMMTDGSSQGGSVRVSSDLCSMKADQAEMASKLMESSCSTSLPGFKQQTVTTVGKSTNIAWQECRAKREEKQRLLGQKGCLIWITGLSGSGKSTLACALDHLLLKRGNLSYVLDGDNLRYGLNKNLGFSAEDRAENIRRIGEVAKLFVDSGVICIASVISPYRKDRDACRNLLSEGEFIEVYMNFPLSICEERDPKGLYKLARAGKIKGFTGIDDPYEAPLNCEVTMEPVDGRCPAPDEMAAQMVSFMEQRGLLGSPRCL